MNAGFQKEPVFGAGSRSVLPARRTGEKTGSSAGSNAAAPSARGEECRAETFGNRPAELTDFQRLFRSIWGEPGSAGSAAGAR